MGRFDHDEDSSEATDEAVGAAARNLRSTIEQRVREVVEDATARAAAIEDRALARANQLEREAQSRAGDALETSIGRAEEVLVATETLQAELGKVVASFREEIEALAAGL